MTKSNIYRDGMVHVCRTMCPTCIFRPANKMNLEPGRVEEMVADAEKNQSTIICHSTLGTKENAACRGFFDKHKTQPLQVAERLGLIKYTKP